MPKKPRRAPDAAPDLSHIEPPLRPQAVPIADLRPDPRNARKHDERNLEAILASLAEFGQQRAILANAKGVVVAGNGVLEAAKRLGWTHLAVVRTRLTGNRLTAYGIADNRTTDLGAFDTKVLVDLLAELQQDDALLATGFSMEEVQDLLDRFDAAGGSSDETTGPDDGPAARWAVLVECKDEKDQARVLELMEKKGYECRAIVN